MFSPVADYFYKRFGSASCDCCDHNIEVMSAENGATENEKTKRSLRNWLASSGRKKDKTTSQTPQIADNKVCKQQWLRRCLCIGRKKGRDIQHRETPVLAQSISVKATHPHSPKPHIQNALDSIFTSMLDSDKLLASQTNPSTQCFLIHTTSDLTAQGAFLSTLRKLPPETTHLDEFASLSYASSWLQSSLSLIRDSCVPSPEPVDLQMPFVLLETEYQLAHARAAGSQRYCPDERVAIATLDLVALREAGLVVSAAHAFQMLRVPVAGVEFSRRLLVWAADENEGVVRALRDAVLAVVECWDEMSGREKEGGETESDVGASEGLAEEDGEGTTRSGLVEEQKKKDSVVTSHTASESSKGGTLNLGDLSVIDGNSMHGRDTCWF